MLSLQILLLLSSSSPSLPSFLSSTYLPIQNDRILLSLLTFLFLLLLLDLFQETKHPLLLIHALGYVHTALQTNARVNRVDSSNDGLIVPMAAQIEDGTKPGAKTVPEGCCGRKGNEGGREELGLV